MKSVSEQYCAFSGDDDFLVPESLSRCAAFLRDNPDYRMAYGSGLTLEIEHDRPHGNITSLSKYMRDDEIRSENPARRIDSLGANYRAPWGVQRYQRIYNEFIEDAIVEELTVISNHSTENASEIVKQAFWKYLQKGIQKRTSQQNTSIKGILKQYVKETLPIFVGYYRKFISSQQRESLLKNSSPYHHDFLPICNFITGASKSESLY